MPEGSRKDARGGGIGNNEIRLLFVVTDLGVDVADFDLMTCPGAAPEKALWNCMNGRLKTAYMADTFQLWANLGPIVCDRACNGR